MRTGPIAARKRGETRSEHQDRRWTFDAATRDLDEVPCEREVVASLCPEVK